MAASDLRTGEVGGSTSEITTGTTDAVNRQPTIYDYAQTNQFTIFFPLFPTMEWFITRANVPGCTLGQADQYTPFVDIAVVGDKMQYENFNCTFLVDEKLNNYMEMYNWVMNIGFPFSGKAQFNKLPRPDNTSRGSTTKYNPRDGVYYEINDRDLYTDIVLTILSSKNNAVANVYIYEAFPVSLGGIEYSQAETDTDYATCDVSFAYTWYDIKPVASGA